MHSSTGPGKIAGGVIRTGVKVPASGNYSNVSGGEERRNQRTVDSAAAVRI